MSVTDYSYNAWNQMVSAGNVTYTYNAQGLRVSKTSSGETNTFTLVGSDVWSDSESKYLRGIELIASDTQIYLYNIRGDVIQLLGFDGEVDKTYDYDAYGNEYSRDLSDENPFRYCGEYYDTETGLIYLRARYYDPTVGRFTTLDPIKDGLNWYSYCDGEPVNRVDRNGLFWTACFIVLAVTAAQVIGYHALTELNYNHNSELDNTPNKTTKNKMINGQMTEPYCQYAYGLHIDGKNTCEAIAIHNAKVYLGIDSSLSETIYEVQKSGGMWAGGLLGSYPHSVGIVLHKNDIDYTYVSSLSEMTEEGMYIISYWYEGKIHTAAIEYNGYCFEEYNCFSDRLTPEIHYSADEITSSFICGYYVGTNTNK